MKHAGARPSGSKLDPSSVRDAALPTKTSNYPPKVLLALDRLAASGLAQPSYAPPLHRSLWQLGINIPPPHFASFFFNFALAGIFFGVGWGVLMAAFFWLRYGTPVLHVLPYALTAGVAFGASMAWYFRHGAKRHKLPRWSTLADSADNAARPR